MPQSHRLISTLKQALKKHGLTYRDIARELDRSESSIKRLFASGNFSLDKLEAITRLMGMELSDLFFQMESSRKQLVHLEKEQEQQLVADPNLLLIAHLVINGWLFEEILDEFSFETSTLISYLVRLDKLKLIELLPMNRFKLLITPSFSWLKNGPVQQFFLKHLRDDFFASTFSDANEQFHVISGMLSDDNVQKLNNRVTELEQEFLDYTRRERTTSVENRKHVGLVIAMRPWKVNLYDTVRRK